MSHPSDRDLVASAQQGQVAAFATLVGRYRDAHTRFALRMLGNAGAADEALLAAFVRAFQSIGRCKEPERFSSWLFRLVINECRSRAMRRAVRERRLTGEVEAIGGGGAGGAASRSRAEMADIQRALDQIDPINREAFILQYVEELSYPQIATLTGAGVPALEAQVDRACERLRELLANLYAEHRRHVARAEADAQDPGPSFMERVAMPLRRPEVLNDSFEDRLMSKLLRPGTTAETPAVPEKVVPAPRPAEPTPSLPPRPAPRANRWARSEYVSYVGGALVAIALGFLGGYAMRARRAPSVAPQRIARAAPPKPTVVKRTDTLRIVRSDTVLLARFDYTDATARSVALLGDFNDWSAQRTPLARGSAKGAWTVTVALPPGRHDYAFLVDGKRWATDRAARTLRDELGIESSILEPALARREAGTRTQDGSTGTARLNALLPRPVSERVVGAIAAARDRGLPTGALQSRALKLAAARVAATSVERAVVADASRLRAANAALATGRDHPALPSEIEAAAAVIRRGADSAAVATFAKSVPAGRELDVPLLVAGELVAKELPASDALALVGARLRNGASDVELERFANEPRSRLASRADDKPKTRADAKAPSAPSIRQAGAPAGPKPSTKATRKPTKPAVHSR